MILASLRDAFRGANPTPDEAGFVADARRTALEQEPLRARLLLRVFAATLLVALAWAAFAHVDEVTRGEGKVIP
ncbi:MAG TPA: hypothetical protein VHL79_13815, partial [Ramlibacter sp.]|nr:hypothetical protein [Ramlibacter sp.]